MSDLSRLPPADGTGSYWWGGRGTGAAGVFRVDNPKSPHRGRWMVCPAGDVPVPFGEDGYPRAFDTPELARRELCRLTHAHARGRGGAP